MTAPPTRSRDRRETVLAAAAVALLVAGLLALRAVQGIPTSAAYLATIVMTALVFAVFGLSLNLQFGFAGLINFGHVAFMALGAYTMALLALPETGIVGGAAGGPRGMGWPLWAAVPAAMGAAVLFGLLLGLPTVRLRADYLSIVTIGAAEALRIVLLNEREVTNGPFGLSGFPRPLAGLATWPPFAALAESLEVPATLLALLLVAAAVLALVFLLLRILTRSPWGRVLRAIRDDEDVAAALGKDVFAAKLAVLGIGAALAAVAGMLYAWLPLYFDPSSFQPLVTFYAWIVVVLGGVGNPKGTIVGAFGLWVLFEVARSLPAGERLGLGDLNGPGQIMFIGLALVVVMMFRPQGFLGRKEEMSFGR